MSVSICIALDSASKATIEAVLAALVQHNAELYARGRVESSPWTLRWVPDSLLVCDAESCRIADTSTLQDVALLESRGFGSCGPLAAAYAAWLRVHERRPAVAVAERIGNNVWHVVARTTGPGRVFTYDPATIGKGRAHG